MRALLPGLRSRSSLGRVSCSSRILALQQSRRSLPALHALGAVVSQRLHHLHGLLAPAGAQAFHPFMPGQTVRRALALGGRQAAQRLGRPGSRLQRLQLQHVHGGAPALLAQVLTQQALQMRHALRGLGRADDKRFPALQLLAVDTAQIMVPAQLQRQHRMVTGLQPGLQRSQQRLRGMEHGIGMVGRITQIVAQLELLRQLQPVKRLGQQTIGLVERTQSLGSNAARQPRARQCAHIAPAPAAQAQQHGAVLLQGAQRP